MANNKHTIILMQPSSNRITRTFLDYDSIGQAMEGLCAMYETKLRDFNPTRQDLTYDISDLFNFLDGMNDLSALVYDHTIQAYLPCDRQWIKTKIHRHLRCFARDRGGFV